MPTFRPLHQTPSGGAQAQREEWLQDISSLTREERRQKRRQATIQLAIQSGLLPPSEEELDEMDERAEERDRQLMLEHEAQLRDKARRSDGGEGGAENAGNADADEDDASNGEDVDEDANGEGDDDDDDDMYEDVDEQEVEELNAQMDALNAVLDVLESKNSSLNEKILDLISSLALEQRQDQQQQQQQQQQSSRDSKS